jgi:hypothetical protein
MVPPMATPSFVLPSTVNVPPVAAFWKVTFPDPLRRAASNGIHFVRRAPAADRQRQHVARSVFGLPHRQ